jgi:hypothetical protein
MHRSNSRFALNALADSLEGGSENSIFNFEGWSETDFSDFTQSPIAQKISDYKMAQEELVTQTPTSSKMKVPTSSFTPQVCYFQLMKKASKIERTKVLYQKKEGQKLPKKDNVPMH